MTNPSSIEMNIPETTISPASSGNVFWLRSNNDCCGGNPKYTLLKGEYPKIESTVFECEEFISCCCKDPGPEKLEFTDAQRRIGCFKFSHKERCGDGIFHELRSFEGESERAEAAMKTWIECCTKRFMIHVSSYFKTATQSCCNCWWLLYVIVFVLAIVTAASFAVGAGSIGTGTAVAFGVIFVIIIYANCRWGCTMVRRVHFVSFESPDDGSPYADLNYVWTACCRSKNNTSLEIVCHKHVNKVILMALVSAGLRQEYGSCFYNFGLIPTLRDFICFYV
eukprot:TRINITY_DN1289_c0_g1_i14.p1 TRINITY_DN1289_c0_g1~~TRINITY_DN1289_c0_g1_i14.p1  ORF type:complete len:280 (+),score=26.47 TRINITY_DN1289_c0_g1_i14:290-1129(+)